MRTILRLTFACALLCLAAWGASARADIVEYQIPRTTAVVKLQGKQNANPGRTITYTHPKFGKLILGLEDVQKIHTVPPMIDIFNRKLGQAVLKKNADQVMEAGRWALSKGLVPQCYVAADKALEIDPQHVGANDVKKLTAKMEVPLGDYSKEEKHMREIVRRSGMNVKTSKHYILLHDTPDTFDKEVRKKPRADERLELLELVYESFLLKFYSQGIELEIPKERLMVVLFNDHKDYLTFATRLSPSLSSASGFWDGKSNVAVFYDHGSSKHMKALVDLARDAKDDKEKALKRKDANTKDIVRTSNTLMMLVEIAKEDADIEVVSHECTHQMAGNTGLLPRDVMIPSWIHEGLATYFESPNDASWSGIGAVNEQRLDWYRGLEKDRVHSNINFIVGDEIFDLAANHASKLHAYGQAWAITHFLMEKHFTKFITYYRRLGEMPPDIVLSPELLTKLFDEIFGTDRQTLDDEWRDYMSSLKTDMEIITKER